MGKFSEAAKMAAENVERLASAMESLPQGGSFSGPGGAGGGGGTSYGGDTFITNVSVPGGGKNITTNSPIGTRGDDLQSRAFAYYGLSSANKSQAFIDQIVKAFSAMLAKGGISFRAMGMS